MVEYNLGNSSSEITLTNQQLDCSKRILQPSGTRNHPKVEYVKAFSTDVPPYDVSLLYSFEEETEAGDDAKQHDALDVE